MDGLKYLLCGLASIFGAYPANSGNAKVEQLRDNLDAYMEQSDRERLASDWSAIGSDMRKALNKMQEDYGQ